MDLTEDAEDAEDAEARKHFLTCQKFTASFQRPDIKHCGRYVDALDGGRTVDGRWTVGGRSEERRRKIV